MEKLIDRKEELSYLEKEYKTGEFRFITITGRRRIGKTYLIRHFLGDKKDALYIFIPNEDKNTIKLDVTRKLAETFKLSFFGYPSWEEIFQKIFQLSKEKKVVLILDEFQRFTNIDNSIFSHLQNEIDKNKADSKLFLVIMGSSIGMMNSIFESKDAPLLGRKTGNLKIKPFKFEHVKELLNLDTETAFRYYNFFGGTPDYLTKIKTKEGIYENITDLVLSNKGSLYEEAENLLKEELTEPKTYFDILRYIASGKNTAKEISDMLSINATSLSHFLDNLDEKLDLIERRVPITEDQQKSKNSRYFIKDQYFRSWFRYVLPNKSELELGNVKPLGSRIKEEENMLLGRTFEIICQEKLRELIKTDELPEFDRIGNWWGASFNKETREKRAEEIDIIALNEKTKTILFAECKWKERINAREILAELKRKSEWVEWNNKNRKEMYAVFAKSFAPSKENDEVLLYSFKDF